MAHKFTPEEFKEAHQSGLTDRSMGKLFGVHHGTIAYHRSKYGLQPNGAQRKPLQKVGEFKAKCSRCGSIKGLKHFTKNHYNTKYSHIKMSYCNDCRRLRFNKTLNSSIEKFLVDKYRRLVVRARKLKIPCSISRDEFIQQYHKQAGKCFYTDIPMDWGAGNGFRRTALSIDKVVPELGYVSGNVVLCINKANTVKCDLTLEEVKLWLPTWWDRISEFLQIPNSQSDQT